MRPHNLPEPAPLGVKLEPKPESSDEREEYDVEEILDSRVNDKGQLEYSVKWEGYGHEDNQWEPVEHLTNCTVRVREFHQRYANQPFPKDQKSATNSACSTPGRKRARQRELGQRGKQEGDIEKA